VVTGITMAAPGAVTVSNVTVDAGVRRIPSRGRPGSTSFRSISKLAIGRVPEGRSRFASARRPKLERAILQRSRDPNAAAGPRRW